MQLLLGCGRSREKIVAANGDHAWRDLVTVDLNPTVGADIVADLTGPLPFADDSAEEMHFYEVLEHLGQQGDWRAFFAQFSEFWRVLKPGGYLCATVPHWSGHWAWGDPGHTRVIQPETLTFLSQAAYAEELDGEHRTNRTDYRHWYRADFALVMAKDIPGPCVAFVLRAVKPSRWKAPT